MTLEKMLAGAKFPEFSIPLVSGGEKKLGGISGNDRWQLVVVYRGLHCPLCAKYLAELDSLAGEYDQLGADVIAISGDGKEKALSQVAKGDLNIPIGYGLEIEQMKALGLYISHPRSPEETDQPFPEPGLFVLRSDGTVQIIDISNAPFSRPDLKAILRGIEFGKKKNYPIRGTF
ncbi:thioredoxin peroxidase [Alphaproteobacteria bacterium 46_93_T64]|nr:thioredoxin peroxidase [Alphaproteobacteria bacterium 46_93_T64]